MSELPRERQMGDYREVMEGLLELLALKQESGDADEQLDILIKDAEEELRRLARALNAEETIAVTEGAVKVLLPHDTAPGGDADGSSEAPVVLFPPAEQPRQCAPYEVHYDNREWYPCVITAVVPPADEMSLRTYRAWILGYNVEEEVTSDALRPWGEAQDEARKDAVRSGAACHAIRPATGRFEAATIERLTLEGTVLVKFPPAAAAASQSPAEDSKDGKGEAAADDGAVVELPLSHIYTGPKFYPVLRKRVTLTDEERQERRRENARRKRERAEEQKQLKADTIAQDANDWQSLMDDLGGGGGGGRSRGRRRF